MKPPKFTGAGNYEAAPLWIKELEKAFALLRCSKEDKVTLAVNHLQGNASTWWEATQRRVFLEGTAQHGVPSWRLLMESISQIVPKSKRWLSSNALGRNNCLWINMKQSSLSYQSMH